MRKLGAFFLAYELFLIAVHFLAGICAEKHKTYHIKDEQLARDGFKKFLKPDPCGFSGCRFSQLCNHIHCVRDGCSYVLHSSGQLLSHKRKHERKDTEIAYRKFKLSQQNATSFNGGSGGTSSSGVIEQVQCAIIIHIHI